MLGLGPAAEFGVFKPLHISQDLKAYPFFGLSYSYLWTSNNARTSIFSGMLGIEMEISYRFGVLAEVGFPLDDSGSTFLIGVNFYPESLNPSNE